MKTHRVFGLNEIHVKLCVPLELESLGELLLRCACLPGRVDVRNQIHQRVHRDIPQLVGPLLDCLHTRAQFLLGPFVAGLTGAIDVQHRASDVMIADLESALPLVRHVTIRARHAGPGMYSLVPHFEFRVLGLERRRSRLRMHPILVLHLGVVTVNIVHLESFVPGINQPLLLALEVILHMTLAADVRTHFLSRRHGVHIVVLNTLGSFQSANPFNESRPGDAQIHCLGIVTVNACDRVLHQFAGFLERQGIDFLETFNEVAVARFFIDGVH